MVAFILTCVAVAIVSVVVTCLIKKAGTRNETNIPQP